MPNAKEKLKDKIRAERSAAGFLTDEEIKEIRKKLGLTQRQMAETLGVGEKNFARYENLSVRQSRAMDNLLRILDAYPEAIRVIDVNKQAADVKKKK